LQRHFWFNPASFGKAKNCGVTPAWEAKAGRSQVLGHHELHLKNLFQRKINKKAF
jgi:hypothetical protein